jgi:hypothetical protein
MHLPTEGVANNMAKRNGESRIAKPWTDKGVRALKPEEADYKEAESGGLFLLIKTNGAK